MVGEESHITNRNIVTDGHRFHVGTFSEHTLRNDHAVGNRDFRNIASCEGILANGGLSGELRCIADHDAIEGILTDVGQNAQLNTGQTASDGGVVLIKEAEAIVANIGNVGQSNGTDLQVMREAASCDGGDVGAAEVSSGNLTSHGGAYDDQLSAVSGDNVVFILNTSLVTFIGYSTASVPASASNSSTVLGVSVHNLV